MRNEVIDGVEYAIGMNGERYEVMIPGTKCPVSIGVLKQWYEYELMSISEIALKLRERYSAPIHKNCMRRILSGTGVQIRTKKEVMAVRIKKGTAPGHSPKSRDSASAKMKILNSERSDRGVWAKSLKKACDASARNAALRRIKFDCDQCGKELSMTPYKASCCVNHFCNMLCANRFNANQRREKNRINSLICPSCFSPSMHSKGSYSRTWRKFYCDACKKITLRPIIELGLRQDLEAAGALDNGRILVSAFVTEKEKATAS